MYIRTENGIEKLTDEQVEARKPKPTYIELRNAERGSLGSQLEYIVENGLEAFIERDNDIRAEFPKETEDGVS